MDGKSPKIDRLYELYQEDFRRLRETVVTVNRSLGSANPEKTWMELMGRDEF